MLIGWRLISNCKKVNNVSVSCIYLIKLLILQQISFQSMKHTIHILGFLLILVWVVACSPDGPFLPGLPTEFVVYDVPSDQIPYILADTVTPPSNPMAPVDLSSYPTFIGTLQMFPAKGFKNLNGQYFCGIELQAPIEVVVADFEANYYSSIYLLDCATEDLVRFDYPLLESCIVGDTILVTGVPKMVSEGVALGLTMYYVQPLHP